MIIAIHGDDKGFSNRWIDYCKENSIAYDLVNMFDNDIIKMFRKNRYDAFLFRLELYDIRTILFASSVARSIETMGVEVFPSDDNFWHYDNKIAQKYLFEALEVPVCKTWVFYDKAEALEWISNAVFPLIFKLKRGAGSSNVKIVKTKRKAELLIRKMFGVGLSPIASLRSDINTKITKHNHSKDWIAAIKRLPKTINCYRKKKYNISNEKGYVYFQEFSPNNHYDTRITIIDNKAFAFRRKVRPNDFRASGSGRIDYNVDNIDIRCIKLAFFANSILKADCIAFDMIDNSDGDPVILEMSYAFIPEAVYECPGYWDTLLKFHHGNFWPQDLIITGVVNKIMKRTWDRDEA